jgi:hypothetical protein
VENLPDGCWAYDVKQNLINLHRRRMKMHLRWLLGLRIYKFRGLSTISPFVDRLLHKGY